VSMCTNTHGAIVGSLKSKVSFAEYSLFYRALLQKRPMILRSLLIVANQSRYTSARPELDATSPYLKIIGLFRRKSSLLWGSFARETYNFKELPHRSGDLRAHAQIRYIRMGMPHRVRET